MHDKKLKEVFELLHDFSSKLNFKMDLYEAIQKKYKEVEESGVVKGSRPII